MTKCNFLGLLILGLLCLSNLSSKTDSLPISNKTATSQDKITHVATSNQHRQDKQEAPSGVFIHKDLWEREAHNLPWFKKWTQTLIWNEPYAHWFAGGELNASYACLDRHVHAGRGNKIAYLWHNEEGKKRTVTYQELYDEVNRMAYVLKSMGVSSGDNVVLYVPMIPESIAAVLATVRLGATHSIVFSGFSSSALKERIDDLQARYVITADYTVRRGKKTNLKEIVDQSLSTKTSVEKVLILQRSESPITTVAGRDILYSSVRPKEPVYVSPQPVESNHPLFILYTSGTTGKPKGIIHSTGGYLTYCYSTFKWTFDPKPQSLYWCIGDIGWITGHSYVIYAPLLHGITSFIYEGAPDYPDPGIWWRMIEQYKISIFYTVPTAIRMAMKAGEKWLAQYDLSSLKVLGTVGEPINPEVWKWYFKHIGNSRCPIIDTWWQTETGGFMIAPQLHQLPVLKPGSVTKALPGIEADILDAAGKSTAPNVKGHLVITCPWPGMTIGIYGSPERFQEIYWSKFKHAYYSGDYAVRDRDGYFWIIGRSDEVLKISGHRIGTAEIESAALTHPGVAEAAAVGIPEEIRGEQIILFVTLKQNLQGNDTLAEEIKEAVRRDIGHFVSPTAIYFVQKLPKTRSGKIMRRLLKSVLEQKSVGDISTIEDETSLQEIQAQFVKLQEDILKQKASEPLVKKS